MSEFKVGDRVRVVHEGTVSRIYRDSGAFVLDRTFSADPKSETFISVEKLSAPLPTTPGSVVKDSDGNYWMLGRADGWYSDHEGDNEFPQGSGVSTSNMLSDDIDAPTYDVIFDAGAS